MATRDDRTDDLLQRRFDDLRADTMTRLRPPGPTAARHAHQTRRRAHIIATAVATAATVLLAVIGGTAALHRSNQPFPVTVSPAPQTPSPALSPVPTSAAPSPEHTTGSRTSGSIAGPPEPHDGGTSRCRAADLSTRYFGGDGHMGSATMYWTVTNTAGHDCTLSGVPGGRAVDSAGKTLATAEKERDTGRKLVLKPDGKVYASIIVGTAGLDENAHKAPCDPPAAEIWLIPPGDTGHLVVDRDAGVCNGEFTVRPFQAETPNAS